METNLEGFLRNDVVRARPVLHLMKSNKSNGAALSSTSL